MSSKFLLFSHIISHIPYLRHTHLLSRYEGTGRSLSLKLLNDLRKRQGQAAHDAALAAADAVAGAKANKVKYLHFLGIICLFLSLFFLLFVSLN